MPLDYKINGTTVELISERGESYFKEFPAKIEKVLNCSNKLIVLISADPNWAANKNVVCLDGKGRIVWEIQDPDTYKKQWPSSKSFFTNIGINKQGELWATNWNSTLCLIDFVTGRIVHSRFIK